MGKNYSVNNISVCILCLLDFNENIVAEDGSMSADLFKLFHDEIYDSLQCDYVDKGKFQNIYVIFPFRTKHGGLWILLKEVYLKSNYQNLK